MLGMVIIRSLPIIGERVVLEGIQNGVILIGAPGLAYEMFVGAIILIVMLLQVGLRRLPLTRTQKSP